MRDRFKKEWASFSLVDSFGAKVKVTASTEAQLPLTKLISMMREGSLRNDLFRIVNHIAVIQAALLEKQEDGDTIPVYVDSDIPSTLYVIKDLFELAGEIEIN